MPGKPAHSEEAFRSAPALRSLGPASELHGVFRSGTLPSTSGEKIRAAAVGDKFWEFLGQLCPTT